MASSWSDFLSDVRRKEAEKLDCELVLVTRGGEVTAVAGRGCEEEERQEWQRLGIPPRFYGASWEGFDRGSIGQEEAYRAVRYGSGKRNLFLTGKNGTGKTHLAMCLVKEGAEYCVISDIFRRIRDNFRLEEELLRKLGGCRLLIFDEVGRQRGSEFERNFMFEVIDRRWRRCLTTVFIGNIDIKEFAKVFGLGLLDRLRPEVVEFDWGSYRGVENGG